MADAMRPPDPPPFDAKAHEKALYDNIRQTGYRTGAPYQALEYQDASGGAKSYVAFMQWTRKLRDSIVANAIYLDDVAGSLGSHISADNARHQALQARVAALEAQQADPFPGSG